MLKDTLRVLTFIIKPYIKIIAGGGMNGYLCNQFHVIDTFLEKVSTIYLIYNRDAHYIGCIGITQGSDPSAGAGSRRGRYCRRNRLNIRG